MFSAEALFNAGAVLGAGGEGEVRRVLLGGKEYAVKRYNEDSWAAEFSLRRELESPWLAVPLAVNQGAQYAYALMELAAGDLQQAITSLHAAQAGSHEGGGGLMEPDAFRAVAAELVAALGALHSRRVRHADFKPANILVTQNNHLRIADFGLARAMTQHAFTCGTQFVMAPEQCASSTLVMTSLRMWLLDMAYWLGWGGDHRPVDVWALGVSMLMLFRPDEAGELVQSAQRRRPSWHGKCKLLPAWLPADLADLIFGAMLVRQPGRRLTVEQIKHHPFFAGVDWPAVEAHKVPLPLDLVALAAAARNNSDVVGQSAGC
ncbi:hypothetical protein MNEG_2359 [Monoraphidium neglectum]|uniref:non-specific serine/threonine protein kinase n=1 Tax=Monoraphidium neglectum TaxID=145388 RepID=A0A0D2K5C5_9CHLO|nr:hypothetical protein MNEG_2359 [Monoraphidium neglectum]KIZ05598.1 hypothetical protein MNEG_2359 [Monoraphidium neglectum]|eukprot:XP_013904617.1 hypothetical protein MNEG_2359 [Monoraphidium neglectum]